MKSKQTGANDEDHCITALPARVRVVIKATRRGDIRHCAAARARRRGHHECSNAFEHAWPALPACPYFDTGPAAGARGLTMMCTHKPPSMNRLQRKRRHRCGTTPAAFAMAVMAVGCSSRSCAGFQPHSWTAASAAIAKPTKPRSSPLLSWSPTNRYDRNFHFQGSKSSSTALSLSPLGSNSAASALTTLVASAAAGTVADRMNLLGGGGGGGGGSGTIVSLLVASALSNVGVAPSSHPLYDICWTKLLPASLALMLMTGLGGDDNELKQEQDDSSEGGDVVKATIKSVSLPFAIGSLGSVLGCILSFVGTLLFGGKAGRWSLPPLDAAVAAGCLCSSYVGGTVNLFATARILGNSFENNGAKTFNLESLLGSMAAADLLVMAIYFAGLTAAVKSSHLQRMFPGRPADEQSTGEVTIETNTDGGKDASIESQISESVGRQLHRETRPAIAGAFASTLACVIVNVSARFERLIYSLSGIPGMGCAAIAVLSTAVGWVLRRIKFSWKAAKGKEEKEMLPWLQREMNVVCPRLSGLCFNLLFAAIGTAANVKVALQHGPASFLFASSALMLHFVTILMGSWAVTKILPKVKLSIEELAVASNAAIGGPATAAAFAGTLAKSSGARSSRKRRGLVLAGTAWGVVGYAVGTSLGVWISKTLLNVVLAEGFWDMSLHP